MFVRTRFQYGSLRLRQRERGPGVWEFRYYETNPDGHRIRQSVILGDQALYKTEADARKATQALGMRLNEEPYRTMVYIAQCLGLRVSEIAALQWDDFDFEKNQLLVQRSFVDERVDEVKTEYSQDYVPLHTSLTEIVLPSSRSTSDQRSARSSPRRRPVNKATITGT